MPHRFDATLKDIVAEHPSDFVKVFGLPTNARAAVLNVDLSTISAASDIVLSFGQPIQLNCGSEFPIGTRCRAPGTIAVL